MLGALDSQKEQLTDDHVRISDAIPLKDKLGSFFPRTYASKQTCNSPETAQWCVRCRYMSPPIAINSIGQDVAQGAQVRIVDQVKLLNVLIVLPYRAASENSRNGYRPLTFVARNCISVRWILHVRANSRTLHDSYYCFLRKHFVNKPDGSVPCHLYLYLRIANYQVFLEMCHVEYRP